MDTLITTILKRPYVVLFLLSYIIIATRVVGWRWMISFLIAGYTIAFTSEFLSINTGFPYGWYFYKYENLQGEWLNNGVPVWDSVSYVFMCFAGMYAALFVGRGSSFRPFVPSACPEPVEGSLRSSSLVFSCFRVFVSSCFLPLLSALLITILDIIVDPVSHMGKRWFLGDIYYYPNPGWYFDITMSNFLGWFLVSFIISVIGIHVLKFDRKAVVSKTNSILSLGLYFGIFGFGLALAVYLREWTLVLADLGWLVVVCLIVFGKCRSASVL
ncbi:MAG: hypothetical protein ACD_62C00070G0004 [uncultured bacterium]|nr:MAG: hypothetical protein ACD_62C00070G0004 [uncultured bacterium]